MWIVHRRYVNFAFVDEPELPVKQERLINSLKFEVRAAYINYHANPLNNDCQHVKGVNGEVRWTYIPAKGPKKTVYPDMNERNPGAEARISHGQSTHPPIMAQIICPRFILM